MPAGQKVRKAVIPAAGFGTRLLPATKIVPKEMFPLAGKPLVQYAVEEAVASGIETIAVVVREEKSVLLEHFRRNTALESFLKSHGKKQEAELIRRLSTSVEILPVLQDEPRGLAHAVACAHDLVGEEPFAVLLPDVVVAAANPCLRQLISAYLKHPSSIIAVREVDPVEVGHYGIVRVHADDPYDPNNGQMLRATSLAEKPPLERGPLHFGIFGRYILEPEIFTYIQNTPPAKDGEVQLTDALDRMCRQRPVYGFRFEGRHYDAGDNLGFLKAGIELALQDPKLRRPLKDFLFQLRLMN